MTFPDATDPYPFLRQLIGGWFHQDFDLGGGSLEEILASYRSVTPPAEVAAARAAIDKLVAAAGDNLEHEFVQRFHPDVDPSGWGMTTREWLIQIRNLL